MYLAHSQASTSPLQLLRRPLCRRRTRSLSSTLFSRSSDGALTRLGSTNDGGSILAACILNDVLYFAGSFDSFQSTQAKNIASYNSSSGAFTALGGTGAGVDNTVNALHCDSRTTYSGPAVRSKELRLAANMMVALRSTRRNQTSGLLPPSAV